MSLIGFDIANVNGQGIIGQALTGEFVILKATEGLRFVDGLHDGFAARVRAAGRLLGHYHYAHVGNSPTAEADFFLANAKARAGEVLALDFEPYGQPQPDSVYPGWIAEFLGRVNSRTGANCWVYLNDDMAQRATGAASPEQAALMRAAPLWKARYSRDAGSAWGWPRITCWQSSGTTIDQDVFYGDAALWRALGVGGGNTDAGAAINPALTNGGTAVTPPLEEDMPKIITIVGGPKQGQAVVDSRGVHHIPGPEYAAACARWVQILASPADKAEVLNQREVDLINAVVGK